MNISIFGLGYVGVVSSACLSNDGHNVIGVDTVQTKVDLINNGKAPIVEKDLNEIIENSYENDLLHATTDVATAIKESEISFICVGTPSLDNGDIDLKYIQRVCAQIGVQLKEKKSFHVVVIRSTILPGSMKGVVIPALEKNSGKKAGVDFGVCINPEFMREGSAVYDFHNPPKTVIGELDTKSGDILLKLFNGIDAPLIRTSLETAEMVKYADNNWHALKVCFGNEIGSLCKKLGIDGEEVMDIFCQDTKLNLSAYYLRPGFAFGGSCLPKDVRALSHKGRELDLDLPVLYNVIASNDYHVERGLKLIKEKGSKKVGILGFSFKAGTDDLRESPVVRIIESLIGKGYDLALYDRNINLSRLLGANLEYILNVIPHIANLMVTDIKEVLDKSDTIVIGAKEPEFENLPDLLTRNQTIIDFAHFSHWKEKYERYEGICW